MLITFTSNNKKIEKKFNVIGVDNWPDDELIEEILQDIRLSWELEEVE